MNRFCVRAVALLVAASSAVFAAEKLEHPKVTIAVGGKTLFSYLPLTLADLRGLETAVTPPRSSTYICVNALLARDGLAPDAVSIIGVGASSGAVAAMQKGQIDGISNLDPVITRLEKGGDVVAVVDTRTRA